MPESSNNNKESAEGLIEKKQIVISSLSFLVKERNQVLFKISELKHKEREILKYKKNLINQNKLFKDRIINELEKHKDLLTESEIATYISRPPEKDDEQENNY